MHKAQHEKNYAIVTELRSGSVWEGAQVSLWGAGIKVLCLDLGGGFTGLDPYKPYSRVPEVWALHVLLQ